jgi:hypothetical protein
MTCWVFGGKNVTSGLDGRKDKGGRRQIPAYVSK